MEYWLGWTHVFGVHWWVGPLDTHYTEHPLVMYMYMFLHLKLTLSIEATSTNIKTFIEFLVLLLKLSLQEK